MPETKPHPPQGKREEPWTEEEKSRGAAKPGEAEAAGGATAGRPTDDRAETEGAAARIDPKATPRR